MTLDTVEVEKLLDMVKHETEKLHAGERFILRDLFKGYQWKRIASDDRKTLSKQFWNYVSHHDTKHIVPLDKKEEEQEYERK